MTFSAPTLSRTPRRVAIRLGAMLLLFIQTSTPLAANPVPADEASVSQGAQIFQRFCTECHGRDGRAQVDVISDATDLTDPEAYYNGTTERDIYNSIAYGAGVGMPPWESQLKSEEDIWHLVNFIRGLWVDE